MQKLITLCALCFIVYSCNNKTATADFKGTDTTAALQAAPAAKASEIDGLWTGVFGSSPADTLLQKRAEAFEEAYYKKMSISGDEGEGEEITDLKLIPADLRPAYYMEPLNGYYARRSANKISVIINGIDEAGQLTGTSVCAGNERPLKGTYTKTGNGFEAELKEPGDDKNDGVFQLSFSPASGKVYGTWTSLAGNTKVCELEKKEFKYDPEAGSIGSFRPKNSKEGYIEFKKNPSTDLLKTTDVENLSRPELTILRNLIYARHGYTFGSASFRNYFESQEWYIPYRKDIRTDLTEREKLNAEKLKSFEKYASAAYDEFGR